MFEDISWKIVIGSVIITALIGYFILTSDVIMEVMECINCTKEMV